ncbi:GNAT family N-acetyltransferase [Aerococcus kribbianus]|uniref:GNAT family N-acetyltransferase n=1 Tax=Aerococcus kribbianus TaxID=2999064 RepID=A0A9X3FRL4_9LACT|nr:MULTISPECIES: GNAT family N-acetyltransferase [unclassified Aerococcus]MCZ0717077.1 GNAT family N-acetyltransferase [Aerococcus sp. YH-aer221]MCZ0725365.1 GNAT family N-acetyltransferase [Aerococcus sp. YH-aer222]
MDGRPRDAKALLDFYKQVGAETDFLDFGSEGLGINQEQETRYLKSLETSDNNRLLIARLGDEIIGVASIGAESKEKVKHVGEVGICILQRFWGFGLAQVLLDDLFDWAKEESPLTLIRLEVAADNIRAIKLYEKYDFERLGKLPKAIKLGHDYADTLIMFKSLED